MENLIQTKNPMLRKFQYFIDNFAFDFIFKTHCKIIIISEKDNNTNSENIDFDIKAREERRLKYFKFLENYSKEGEVLFDKLQLNSDFMSLIAIQQENNFKTLFIDEIEKNLIKEEVQATAYIKDVVRWILETIKITGSGINSDLCKIINSKTPIMQSCLEITQYENPCYQIWVAQELIYLCWWFYDSFETKCKDYGYNIEEIYNSMYSLDSEPQQPNIIHGNTENAQKNNIEDNKKNPNILLPQQLQSEQALKYLEKAIKLGFLDTNYQWIKKGHTRYQQAYLANGISKALEISNKWGVFGDLWGYKRLSQTYNDVKNNGSFVANRNLLDSIWKN